MKKCLFLGLTSAMLSWGTVFGQVASGEIKNFNFDYQAPLGQGTAENFFYHTKLTQEQKVFVEKWGDEFKIKLEGVEEREIVFKNPPTFIKEAADIKLSHFNLSLNQAALISVEKAHFSSPDKQLELSNFSLNCNRFASHTDLMDQLISGCLEKMVIKAGVFNSRAEEGLEQAFTKALDASFDTKQSIGVKNMTFKISGGKFDLSAEIKAQISGKATSTGSLKYDQPAKKLTLKINQVKFGILDVTSRVFDELKKQENFYFEVNEPYVYITIK